MSDDESESICTPEMSRKKHKKLVQQKERKPKKTTIDQTTRLTSCDDIENGSCDLRENPELMKEFLLNMFEQQLLVNYLQNSQEISQREDLDSDSDSDSDNENQTEVVTENEISDDENIKLVINPLNPIVNQYRLTKELEMAGLIDESEEEPEQKDTGAKCYRFRPRVTKDYLDSTSQTHKTKIRNKGEVKPETIIPTCSDVKSTDELSLDRSKEEKPKKTRNRKKVKCEDLKEYQKSYHKSEKWQSYYKSYVESNKIKLNEKRKQERKNQKEILTLLKKCISENSLHCDSHADLDRLKELLS